MPTVDPRFIAGVAQENASIHSTDGEDEMLCVDNTTLLAINIFVYIAGQSLEIKFNLVEPNLNALALHKLIRLL